MTKTQHLEKKNAFQNQGLNEVLREYNPFEIPTFEDSLRLAQLYFYTSGFTTPIGTYLASSIGKTIAPNIPINEMLYAAIISGYAIYEQDYKQDDDLTSYYPYLIKSTLSLMALGSVVAIGFSKNTKNEQKKDVSILKNFPALSKIMDPEKENYIDFVQAKFKEGLFPGIKGIREHFDDFKNNPIIDLILKQTSLNVAERFVDSILGYYLVIQPLYVLLQAKKDNFDVIKIVGFFMVSSFFHEFKTKFFHEKKEKLTKNFKQIVDIKLNKIVFDPKIQEQVIRTPESSNMPKVVEKVYEEIITKLSQFSGDATFFATQCTLSINVFSENKWKPFFLFNVLIKSFDDIADKLIEEKFKLKHKEIGSKKYILNETSKQSGYNLIFSRNIEDYAYSKLPEVHKQGASKSLKNMVTEYFSDKTHGKYADKSHESSEVYFKFLHKNTSEILKVLTLYFLSLNDDLSSAYQTLARINALTKNDKGSFDNLVNINDYNDDANNKAAEQLLKILEDFKSNVSGVTRIIQGDEGF